MLRRSRLRRPALAGARRGSTGSSPYSPRVAKSMIRSTASASVAAEGLLRIEHEFESTGAFGRASGFCRCFCTACLAAAPLAASSAAGEGEYELCGLGSVPRRWGSGRRLGSAWSWRRERLLVGGKRWPCGSSMICSSAPMITSSGFPLPRSGGEGLFVGVVVEGFGGVLVGAVGHRLHVFDECVGNVEAGGEGDLEALPDREVGLDPPEGVCRSPA